MLVQLPGQHSREDPAKKDRSDSSEDVDAKATLTEKPPELNLSVDL